MKKLQIIIILAASMLFIVKDYTMAYSTGSVGGYSSSKGDGTRSCGKNGCHGGQNIIETGWITTDIPSTGYELGKEYTVTIQAKVSGITRYGFELSAEDLNGNNVGSFNANGMSDYQVISGALNPSGNGHATHTSNGIDNASSIKKWHVIWTAPLTGNPSNITFSAAVLAANKNWMSSGDMCHISSLMVKPRNTVSIFELQPTIAISLYPNPTKGHISIVFADIDKSNFNIDIVSMRGTLIKQITPNKSNTYNISDLPMGHYIVQVEQNGTMYKKQLLKL